MKMRCCNLIALKDLWEKVLSLVEKRLSCGSAVINETSMTKAQFKEEVVADLVYQWDSRKPDGPPSIGTSARPSMTWVAQPKKRQSKSRYMKGALSGRHRKSISMGKSLPYWRCLLCKNAQAWNSSNVGLPLELT
jgi:hypothetical protein